MENPKPETLQRLRELILKSEGISLTKRQKARGFTLTSTSITFPRILMALGKKEGEWHITVWGNGVCRLDKRIDWNLLHDADDQQEETLQAIINILQANLNQE